MLIGKNGIIGSAGQASETTKDVSEDEQLKLAVADALIYGTGTLTTDNVRQGLISEFGENKVTDTTFTGTGPWTFKGERKTYTIEKNGKITSEGTTTPQTGKSTLEQAKDDVTIFEKKETLEDKYGNKVVVPEGFKIAEDSATDVTGGVVIEDASDEPTKGSQFVWIPVGDVKTASGTENIKLSRYIFADGENDKGKDGSTVLPKGTPIEKGSADIPASYMVPITATETLISNGTSYNGFNEVADADVYEAFVSKTEDGGTKTKVETTGGYYIGRYEARRKETQITENGSDEIYNNITQPLASSTAKGMYTGKSFKSDLMNSYAWDTALVYLQTFDDRGEKGTPYSYQTSLNKDSSPDTKGTKELDPGKQDKICNIWDLASNCNEYTTETSSYQGAPAITRGITPQLRTGWTVSAGPFKSYSFRPLLVITE